MATAPCPPLHAQRTRIHTRVGKRVQSPNSTTRATPGIVFHPASAIDETAMVQVQTDLRRRTLRAFVGRACQTVEGALPVGGVVFARIYEVLPLLCPLCGGQMRLIAFITEGI